VPASKIILVNWAPVVQVVILATWQVRLGGLQFKVSWLKKIVASISKITRVKWTEGVAQAVDSSLRA
jgi:hypothetical protein